MTELCQFAGCTREQTLDQPKTGLRLCEEHANEMKALVRESNIPGIVKFWVRSGGLDRVKQSILEDES